MRILQTLSASAVLLLSQPALGKEPPSPSQPEQASITINQPGQGAPLEIVFTADDLLTIEGTPEALFDRLRSSAADCCLPRTRLGPCVWECCDQAKVDTCNETLKTAIVVTDPVYADLLRARQGDDALAPAAAPPE